MPDPAPTRWRKLGQNQLLWGLLVVAACIAGGSLECQRPALSPVEEHGRELYTKMCVVCHGPAGEGYKADEAPAIGHADFLATASDTFLRGAIANGRPGTTMSAWSTYRGGPLGAKDLESVIAYMRKWQRTPPIKLDDTRLQGNVDRGKVLYDRECVRCHGDKGVGGPNVHIGSRDFLASASTGYLRHVIANGRAPTAMPAFAKKLGPVGVDDVIATLRSFAQAAPPPDIVAPAKPPPIPLGPVPLNPKGPEPVGFVTHPGTTPAEVIKAQLDHHARMAILDARAPSDYTNSHIAGAVSVPFYDPSPYFDKLPKDSWLVCYCSCPHAESGMLADALQKHGFKKVTVLAEGLGFWATHTYGVKRGTEP